eukprot:3918232-Ditylum_brightwellii.AAC.1
MDGLIPDATDYTCVHMDNATLTVQEGEKEEEGVEWSGGKAKEEEDQDGKRDYDPNAVPSNVGHD